MAFKREKVIKSAEKYVSKGKLEAAIKEYRKVLADNPNDINTLNRVGDLYARAGKPDEAIKLFSQIAERYTRDGFFVKAIAIYKKILKLDAKALPVYERLAELYFQQGLINDARSQYQFLADYYQKQENATSAITIYQRMAEMEPSNPAYHLKLAELYAGQQLVDKALQEYRQLADLMLVEGKIDEAVQVYETALPLADHSLDLIREFVSTLTDGGHTGAAAHLLSKANAINPEAANLAVEVGLIDPEPEAAEAAEDDDVELPGDGFLPATDSTGSFDRPAELAVADPEPAPDSRFADQDDEEEFTFDLDDDSPAASEVQPVDFTEPDFDTAVDESAEFEIELDLDAGEILGEMARPQLAEADLVDPDFGEATVFSPGVEAVEPVPELTPQAEAESPPVEVDWGQAAMDELDVPAPSFADPPAASFAEPAVPSFTDEPVEVPAPAAGEAVENIPFELDFDFEDDESPAYVQPPDDLVGAPDEALPAPVDEPAPEAEPDPEPVVPPDAPEAIEIEAPAQEPTLPEPGVAGPSELDAAVMPAAATPAAAPSPAEPADGDATAPAMKLDPGAAPPEPVRRDEDLVDEARVFTKYGLLDRAADRLDELLLTEPSHLEGLMLRARLDLQSGDTRAVIQRANQLAEEAERQSDQRFWRELRAELEHAGYGFDGERVDHAPGAGPAVEDDRIAQLLQDLNLDSFDTLSGGSGAVKSLLAEAQPADTEPTPAAAEPPPPPSSPAAEVTSFSLADELGGETWDEAASAEPVAKPAAPVDLDETGMSWLDEPTPEPTTAADPGSSPDALFDGEDDFFDLAAELEQELGDDAELKGVVISSMESQEQSLEEVIEGFKQGVAENLSAEDYDTHFNLGIAYREMGLLDEAIGEFQLASKDARYLVESASMLGMCFLEKGLPELAVKWYQKGLEVPDADDNAVMGLLYDLGSAYQGMGENEKAYKAYVEIYGMNSNFRDVSTKLQETAT